MRNLYMTIEHNPQCDKISCKASGMNRQAVSVSGTGRALVDLAGEIAIKGITNYVYGDDDSVQFPSREHSVRKKRQRLPKQLVLSSRIAGYSTRRTSSSSVCASRLARHCSHRREQRSVRLILTTSAESVQRKSLMHPKGGSRNP